MQSLLRNSLKSTRRAPSFCHTRISRPTRWFSSGSPIQDEETVLLRNIAFNATSSPFLTKPLRHGKAQDIPGTRGKTRDSFSHSQIIGKKVREVVISKKGVALRIARPSLAEYTDLCPRVVTPIYSQDANIIVSLLDLHPTAPEPTNSGKEKLEIFEAGTGHGALTLNLARAIYAANTAAPVLPESIAMSERPYRSLNLATEPKNATPPDSTNESSNEIVETVSHISNEQLDSKSETSQNLDSGLETDMETPDSTTEESQIATETKYATWRSNRRAIIHTLDNSELHSAHARKVVKQFRNGMYFPHIDFHVGDIESFISSKLTENSNQPFLDHGILDLPATHKYIEVLTSALKTNGTLLTFCPSITQINKSVMLIKEKGLPLFLERVVEVGGGVASGGREWSVQLPKKPRALQRAEEKAREEVGELEAAVDTSGREPVEVEDDTAMICRPKPGLRISGGGFIGLWRRIRDS